MMLLKILLSLLLSLVVSQGQPVQNQSIEFKVSGDGIVKNVTCIFVAHGDAHLAIVIISSNLDECEVTTKVDCKYSLEETGALLEVYEPNQTQIDGNNYVRSTYSYAVNSSLVQSVCCKIGNNPLCTNITSQEKNSSSNYSTSTPPECSPVGDQEHQAQPSPDCPPRGTISRPPPPVADSDDSSKNVVAISVAVPAVVVVVAMVLGSIVLCYQYRRKCSNINGESGDWHDEESDGVRSRGRTIKNGKSSIVQLNNQSTTQLDYLSNAQQCDVRRTAADGGKEQAQNDRIGDQHSILRRRT